MGTGNIQIWLVFATVTSENEIRYSLPRCYRGSSIRGFILPLIVLWLQSKMQTRTQPTSFSHTFQLCDQQLKALATVQHTSFITLDIDEAYGCSLFSTTNNHVSKQEDGDERTTLVLLRCVLAEYFGS